MKPSENHNIYENIEELDKFLFSLDPVLECFELGNIQVSVYLCNSKKVNYSDLYVRIWDGFNLNQTYHSDELYCSKYSFLIKDLKEVFITRILNDDDLLEIYFKHTKGNEVINSKVTITKEGEVIAKKMKLAPFDSPFSKALNNVTLTNNIIFFHPNYYNIEDNLRQELKNNLSDIDYNYNSKLSLGANNPSTYLFSRQKLKNKFEDVEKLWINSGILTDQIRKPDYGLHMSYQYFIAFRINGELHFYLSPKMSRIKICKSDWSSNMNCSVEFEFEKFSFDYDKRVLETKKVELNKTGINEQFLTKNKQH